MGNHQSEESDGIAYRKTTRGTIIVTVPEYKERALAFTLSHLPQARHYKFVCTDAKKNETAFTVLCTDSHYYGKGGPRQNATATKVVRIDAQNRKLTLHWLVVHRRAVGINHYFADHWRHEEDITPDVVARHVNRYLRDCSDAHCDFGRKDSL